jgi:DNA-binding transcriptional LysR family regulator
VLSFAAGGRDFERVVSTFASDHPGCRTVVYEAFPGEALNRLRRGELDLMAHWLPISQPELTIGPVLATEERALAVSVGHPLAERGWATVEDLADHAVIDAEGIMPAETVDVLYPRRTPGGRPIPRRQREGRTAEVLSLVARGEIVHPTVASLPLYYTHPGVTTIPLRGLPPVTAALIWVTDHETAAIRAFADTASSTVTSTVADNPSPGEHHVL